MSDQASYTPADHFLSDFSKIEARVLASLTRSPRAPMYDLFYGSKIFTPETLTGTPAGRFVSNYVPDEIGKKVFVGIDPGRHDASVVATARRDDNGTLTIDKIFEVSRGLKSLPPAPQDMTLAPRYAEKLARASRDLHETRITDTLYGNPKTAFGIPVKESSFFPYEVTCSSCEGSGSGGEEATYCPKCKGTGATRYVGMMNSGNSRPFGEPGQTVFLTEALQRKFEPSFPKGLMPIPNWR